MATVFHLHSRFSYHSSQKAMAAGGWMRIRARLDLSLLPSVLVEGTSY
jgi:hypothetical protein